MPKLVVRDVRKTWLGMSRLVVLVGLAIVLAFAMPSSTEAASFSEVKKVFDSDAQVGDSFGDSVAVSGETVLVGADRHDIQRGMVFVYERDVDGQDNWGEVTVLTASDTQILDLFGRSSVAVDTDTAVVGARWHRVLGQTAGAAYVYNRDEGGINNWGEVKKLTPSDAGANDQFATSVAVSGDTIVVGTAVSHAAYVFQRNRGGVDNWGEVKKLLASDAQALDTFGDSVALSEDTVVIGARGGETGAAYVYQRDKGGAENWGEVKKLTASDAGISTFGVGVAVNGDWLLAGADASLPDPEGAAYVFYRDEGGADNWGQVKKLVASDGAPLTRFGYSVAIGSGTAIVGAWSDSTAASDAGAAYTFERNAGGENNWGEVQKLFASDADPIDLFGFSVALDGEFAVFGAVRDSESFPDAGAAYIFQQTAPVGGISLDSDLRTLPLETADPGSSPWAVVVAIVVAASLLAVGGAALWARRRTIR